MAEIIRDLPESIVKPTLEYPGVLDVIDLIHLENQEIKSAIYSWL